MTDCATLIRTIELKLPLTNLSAYMDLSSFMTGLRAVLSLKSVDYFVGTIPRRRPIVWRSLTPNLLRL